MKKQLSQAQEGKTAIVIGIDGGESFKSKISSIGIRVGKKMKILSAQPFNGPIIIRIGNSEVALGRKMAEKIIVNIK